MYPILVHIYKNNYKNTKLGARFGSGSFEGPKWRLCLGAMLALDISDYGFSLKDSGQVGQKRNQEIN